MFVRLRGAQVHSKTGGISLVNCRNTSRDACDATTAFPFLFEKLLQDLESQKLRVYQSRTRRRVLPSSQLGAPYADLLRYTWS